MVGARSRGTVAVVMCLATGNAVAQPVSCGFQQAFDRADKDGAGTVHVYESKTEPKIGGVKALAYVNRLNVNTDGTRISYKVDDPKAEHGAINNIKNALNPGHSIAEFEAAAAANWQPLKTTWEIISNNVIEMSAKKGSKDLGPPCVDANKYLISMTSDVAVAGAYGRQGDCDASKWIDALTVEAIVLPSPKVIPKTATSPRQVIPTEFDTRQATNRNVAIVLALDGSNRISYGIVGDKGPDNKLGEASVAMNRTLNGLPTTEIPANGHDAIGRFQGPKSIVLLFPAKANRLPYPINADTVKAFAKAKFDSWGGAARLRACLGEIPEAH